MLALEQRKILIVDDKQDNLFLLSTLLESKGYNVRKAINGEIALTGAELIQPDLILLDINMPGLDGYEVCRQLKQNENTKDIPIIFLTVSDHSLDKIKGFELGCVDYITKPFDVQEVLYRVATQINLYQETQKLKLTKIYLKNQVIEERVLKEKVIFLRETFNEIITCGNFNLAIYTMLKYLCELINWDFGEIWFPSKDKSILDYGYIFYGNKPELLKNFPNRLEPYILSEYIRLPLQVCQTQKIMWIDNFASNLNLSFESQAQGLEQIKTIFGIPIIFKSKVLAVFIIINSEIIKYDYNLVNLVQDIIQDLGKVIYQKLIETNLKQSNHKLKSMANIDPLTRLANRRQFDKSLKISWEKLTYLKLPLSLILCDVDCFKLYNDNYGHSAGDDCLRKVARMIAHTVYKYFKQPSNLIARYGGEEFALILPNCSAKTAFALAELIRKQVLEMKILHEKSLCAKYVSLSLGVITVIPTQDHLTSNIIESVDQALYQAKAQGRNQTVLYNV